MFKVVIPARYASTRLPGKPLRDIAGKPMVQWVFERSRASGADEVWIATDDPRIAAAGANFGARVMMTDLAHESGTDRIAEVAERNGWADACVVVNVQGDEPLLPPALIRQTAELLQTNPLAGIGTLATPIASLSEFLDPNVVKVACAEDGRALYFSRAPIPWTRDGASSGLASQARFDGALRHLGIYAYRVGVLRRLAELSPSILERRERLEQLRALENGIVIALGVAEQAPGPGVDTEQDLIEVSRRIEREQAGKGA